MKNQRCHCSYMLASLIPSRICLDMSWHVQCPLDGNCWSTTWDELNKFTSNRGTNSRKKNSDLSSMCIWIVQIKLVCIHIYIWININYQIDIYIYWVWPPHSNSDHQDYYIFSRGSQPKPSFPTVTGRGPYPICIYINKLCKLYPTSYDVSFFWFVFFPTLVE